MADYLLDTNTLSYWYNTNCSENSRVISRIDAVRQPDPESGYVPCFFISVITLGEIVYGARVNPAPDGDKQRAYEQFIHVESPMVLDLTRQVAECYGDLRAWLFENCSPRVGRTRARRPEQLIQPSTSEQLGIDENDLWIAASAMTYNLVLVTHDSRGNLRKVLAHFQSSLQVEDWTL